MAQLLFENNYQFFLFEIANFNFEMKREGAYTECIKVCKPFNFGGGQGLFRALHFRTCTIEKFISLKRVLNTELEIFFSFQFFYCSPSHGQGVCTRKLQGNASSKIHVSFSVYSEEI